MGRNGSLSGDNGPEAFIEVFDECIDEMEADDAIDKTEYREFLLPLIFYKTANDTFLDEYDEVVEDFGEDIAAEESSLYKFMMPEDFLWDDLKATNKRVDEKLNEAFQKFEDANLEFDTYFDVDYLSFDADDSTIKNLLEKLDRISLSVERIEYGDITEAYMSLIRRFAEEEDRDAGEFYQPQRVIDMVVRMLSPFEDGDFFYDPTAGSGDILIGVASHYRNQGGEPNKLKLVAQESIKGMTEAAALNCFLNDVEADIEASDPLHEPMRNDDGSLKKFDYVLTNFPYSEAWNKAELKDQPRFGQVSKDPRKDRADYAYILHMISSLEEDGQLATLAPQGVLFRKHESPFRKHMLEEDFVEAVIGLPEKLFGEDTGIAPAILFLNKDKPRSRENEVLFLHTAHEDFYKELDNKNRLKPSGVDESVEFFDEWKTVERKCRVVDVDEIRKNDYNLNIPLYVDTTEPEEDIDTVEEAKRLAKLEDELDDVRNHLKDQLRKLYGEGVNDYE